ncbi:DMT family transporter [Mesorhizobium sp. ES1-3]|uniref:DMT family transporter n=1 Tax=Mesorhizobium sp. ES1-3 TaxID=2876628 RepID=UPI001CC9E041|nr:DMT family transporter [Mesorhizobium sp. ES1-3]MBZ9674011.1 DMT family transporter [Mesorhizobium sp. ES1-3]
MNLSFRRKKSRRSVSTAVYSELALGMAAFGSATPISKIVTGAMPVFIGSLLRVAIGAVVLAPFSAGKWRQIGRLSRFDWMLISVIALFGMFGFSTLMLYGMKSVSGVAGATVMSTTPAVTAVASMLFLGDRPTWRKCAAIVLAVGGVFVLHLGQDTGSGANGEHLLLGSMLVFGAVCCEAVYTLVGKKALEHLDPILVTFLATVIALPIFLPFAIWQWRDFEPSNISPAAWGAVLWYGAGTLGLGSWLWYSGVAKAEGSIAAGFMGVMPASALILSYILLGEPFRIVHLAGFAIVFAGVLLISWEHARASQ